jgi:site-specific DNA-adenine methylase
MSAEPITRPALHWFGGKWRLAPWVIEHLPPHDAYCEPYGGAASVLLRKPQAKLETWKTTCTAGSSTSSPCSAATLTSWSGR